MSDADVTDDLIGQVIADRYRVVAPIGGGGMGLVYRAEQITLGKTVAIKVLKKEYADQQIYLDRFLQEARAASQIGHENVVDIIDFGQIPGGSAFFAMEYLEGEDLDRLLERQGRLPWPRVRTIVQQVMRALEAAHRRGIVHRDMKPANCFMVRRSDGVDQVKVFDFGIAKVKDLHAEGTGGLTQTGAIFGTAKYMAPEQARGDKIDARTDVYALGVMMFELVTGQAPFPGDNFMQVLTKHLTAPAPVASQTAPQAGISRAVDQLILRAMAKNPDERFESMAAFEAAMLALDGDSRAPTGDMGFAEAPVARTQFVSADEIDLNELTAIRPQRGRMFAWAGGALAVVVLGLLMFRSGSNGDEAPSGAAGGSVVAASDGSPGGGGSAGSASAAEPDFAAAKPAAPATAPAGSAPVAVAAATPEPAAAAPAVATGRQKSSKQKGKGKGKGNRRPRKGSKSKQSSPESLPKPPKEVAASTPTSSGGGGDLSASAIRKGLAGIDAAVKACRDKHGGVAGMTVRVRFMIASASGTVQTASAQRPHAKTPLGQCVAAAVRKAKFPAGHRTKITTQAFRL
ncbi:MAG: serine/threonine protein kinase [Myxococcales bacterium FL481]|nr:MAG: serine/threonine protein kinase [Myxococcales bacterium FL481]